MSTPVFLPPSTVTHLKPDVWGAANRCLLAKAVGEFAHEGLLQPVPLSTDAGTYSVPAGPDRRVLFKARRYALDHWHVDPSSLRCIHGDFERGVDVGEFVAHLARELQILALQLPEYLHELTNSVAATAFVFSSARPSARELLEADFQAVEAAMYAGHPIFLANHGRLGFSLDDYPRYAPEAATPFALVWLAAVRVRAEFSCVQDLDYATLLAEELSADELSQFAEQLASRALSLDDVYLIPVHPWQWRNCIAQSFAADLADGSLVYLGSSRDQYRPQQSIRTLFNTTSPRKRYVKTALSIVNMGFSRGISPGVTARAPATNDWVFELVSTDPTLQHLGFSVLREVAFVSYRHRYYEQVVRQRSSEHREMLAAQWREPATTRVGENQRLMTMAALLYVDKDGAAFLPELIRASGLPATVWLRRFFRHYLTPLLHCFYAHNLLFTPHCENTLIILENHVPRAVLLKDLAEDIGVTNPEVTLPPSVQHLALEVPDELMTLAIFTDVFDCVFRLLAPLLAEHSQLPEAQFWDLVAECIVDYQREHPELAKKFERYDLFSPTFARNCLNRLQLRNNRSMIDLNAPDPVSSLQLIGELENPIAHHRSYAAGSNHV